MVPTHRSLTPPSGLFQKNVVIETRDVGRLRAVGSVREAAEVLLDEWPEAARSGPAYGAATRACQAALQGEASAASARSAFVDAAKAADIFVREGR